MCVRILHDARVSSLVVDGLEKMMMLTALTLYFFAFELVQAYRPKLCPPRRMEQLLKSHIYGIILTDMNSGRAEHSQFFCSDPRTNASGENVYPPTS